MYTKYITERRIPKIWCLKIHVYNCCDIMVKRPTLTNKSQNKLAAAHTKMERSILNITYKESKTNIWVIRQRTKVIDINTDVTQMKWSRAELINRIKDVRSRLPRE